MIRTLLSISILFFSLISAPSFAQNCGSAMQSITTAEASSWALDRNVFSSSVDTTIFWGGTWLSLTQAGKVIAFEQSFLTPGFVITLPMDIGLTVASHFFALENFPAAQNLSDRQEFWARAAFNTGLGSIVIPSFWALYNALNGLGLASSQYEISPTTCLGAAGLCAVVYPTLQKTKNFLFKERPLAQDQSRFEKLSKDFEVELKKFIEDTQKREAELELSPKESSRLAVLATLIGSQPYEKALENFPEPNVDPAWNSEPHRVWEETQKILKELHQLEAQIGQSSNRLASLYLKILKKDRDRQIRYQQIQLRHQLIRKLLQLERLQVNQGQIQELLHLGEGFSVERSLEFHQSLQSSLKQRRVGTIVHSFIDQMLAVGIAGGVFLYGLNHWAATGETPWFIRWATEGGVF